MNNLVIPASVPATLRSARIAGATWSEVPLRNRLAVIHRARRLIADQAESLAATVDRPPADTLVAEVLPLLEAARFLERRAPRLLAPRRLRGGRPAWLFGVRAWRLREPLGTVLILAPGNYPLFLPAVQALQALAAGNAVVLKPAPEGVTAAAAFCDVMASAGLPVNVLQRLDPAAGPEAAAAGFDHIVLTGSAETGVRVLDAAAPRLTPCTMELSGSDAVFVLPGADLVLVARCLAYGLRLNGGATCIAPRRVFVTRDSAAALESALLALLPALPDAWPPSVTVARLQSLLDAALAAGARLHHAGPGRPWVVADARPGMPLLSEDVFAPWLALVPVDDMAAALAADACCPFALGASVFGPAADALALARRVRAGSVCVNDLIVPTADPRLPFGGSGRSGFGRTRGAEGLLAMTAPRTISARRWFRPHLAAPQPVDAVRFAAMARLLHGGWRGRVAALKALAGGSGKRPT